MDINELRQKLSEGFVTITFTKVDGSERVMHCTTNPGLIPPKAQPIGKLKVKEQTEEKVIRVYDVQANGWRSFRFDSVKDVA